MSERRRLPIATLTLALAASITAGQGCTATQVREHTRESYRPPDVSSPTVTRILPAERDRVYHALLEWLVVRSVAVEDEDEEAGRIVADLRFGSDAAQAASVRMGSVRTVVTRTDRRFLTYWPFEAHCEGCIIRRGNLISAETKLVDDRVIELSPIDYEIAAFLRAEVAAVPEGTRVELNVDFDFRPRSPPGLAPASTGLLEEAVLEALEQATSEEMLGGARDRKQGEAASQAASARSGRGDSVRRQHPPLPQNDDRGDAQ